MWRQRGTECVQCTSAAFWPLGLEATPSGAGPAVCLDVCNSRRAASREGRGHGQLLGTLVHLQHPFWLPGVSPPLSLGKSPSVLCFPNQLVTHQGRKSEILEELHSPHQYLGKAGSR